MTDRPILFSTPMVQAVLAGRKTQTRRILKLPTKNIYERPDMGGWASAEFGGPGVFRFRRDGTREDVPSIIGIWHQTTGRAIEAPYQVGDRLWVKETWSHDAPDHNTARRAHEDMLSGGVSYGPYYRATEVAPETLKWGSPISMPRWASRLTLLVTEVRVQRLRDISEEDAAAEGALRMIVDDEGKFYESDLGSYRCGFAGLWCHLNGAESWDANPYVAAVTFEVQHRNIDAPADRTEEDPK
jgi:hypothetical protein